MPQKGRGAKFGQANLADGEEASMFGQPGVVVYEQSGKTTCLRPGLFGTVAKRYACSQSK